MKTTWPMVMLLVFALGACESAESDQTAAEAAVTSETTAGDMPEPDRVGQQGKRRKMQAQRPSLCTALAPSDAMLVGLHGTTLTLAYADGGQKSVELSLPPGTEPSWVTASGRDGLVLVSVRGRVDALGNPMTRDSELPFTCGWTTYVSLYDSDLNLLWQAQSHADHVPRLDTAGGVWLVPAATDGHFTEYTNSDGASVEVDAHVHALAAPMDGRLPVSMYSYNKYNSLYKHWGWFDMANGEVKFFGQPSYGKWPELQHYVVSEGHVFHQGNVWALLNIAGKPELAYLTSAPGDSVHTGILADRLGQTFDKGGTAKYPDYRSYHMGPPTSSGWLMLREQTAKIVTRLKLPDLEAGEQLASIEVLDQPFPEGFQPSGNSVVWNGQLDEEGNVYVVLNSLSHVRVFRYPVGGGSWQPVGAPMAGLHNISITSKPGALLITVTKKKAYWHIGKTSKETPEGVLGKDEHLQLIGRPGDGLGEEKTIIVKSIHAVPDRRGRCVAFEQQDESGQSALYVLDWDHNAKIHRVDASFRQMAFVN